MFLCLLAFTSQTTGFDLYSHAISYYYYEQSINHSYLFFNQIVLPRYSLLSIFYEFASRIGVPVALFAFILTSIANYLILKTILRSNRLYIYDLFLINIVIILNLFYSGLSLVLLFLLAYIKTKKTPLILGSLFHPVGILLFFPLIIINKKLFSYLIIITLFTIFLFYSAEIELLYGQVHDSFEKTISIDTLQQDLAEAYERKKQEILAGITFIAVAVLFRGKTTRKIFFFLNKKIKLKNIKTGATAMSLFLALYMGLKPSPNLLKSIISFDINEVIYVAWFDFGQRDSNMSHAQLYSERYRYVDVE